MSGKEIIDLTYSDEEEEAIAQNGGEEAGPAESSEEESAQSDREETVSSSESETQRRYGVCVGNIQTGPRKRKKTDMYRPRIKQSARKEPKTQTAQPQSSASNPQPQSTVDLVGTKIIRQFVDVNWQRRALYGSIYEQDAKGVVVEYSKASLSYLKASLPDCPLRSYEHMTFATARGCMAVFSERHGKSSTNGECIGNPKEEGISRWLLPDNVEVDTGNPQRTVLTFKEFVMELVARQSEIPGAGLGVFLRVVSLQDGVDTFVIEEGNHIDLGVYSPLRKEDLLTGCEGLVKSFLFDGEVETWSFSVTEKKDEERLYDITDHVTGKLHDLARRRTLTYVNETDGRELPTVTALRDPLEHIHYLLGPADGQTKLSIPCNKWIEIKVDYGESYENTRKLKGYSRTQPNTAESVRKAHEDNTKSTLDDIIKGWEHEDIDQALKMIEKLSVNWQSSATLPKNRALLLLLVISIRLWILLKKSNRLHDFMQCEDLKLAWVLITNVLGWILFDELLKTFTGGIEKVYLQEFMEKFGTKDFSASPILQKVLKELHGLKD